MGHDLSRALLISDPAVTELTFLNSTSKRGTHYYFIYFFYIYFHILHLFVSIIKPFKRHGKLLNINLSTAAWNSHFWHDLSEQSDSFTEYLEVGGEKGMCRQMPFPSMSASPPTTVWYKASQALRWNPMTLIGSELRLNIFKFITGAYFSSILNLPGV